MYLSSGSTLLQPSVVSHISEQSLYTCLLDVVYYRYSDGPVLHFNGNEEKSHERT